VPPPDIVKAARHAPDHWLAFVDPMWRGEGEAPLWAIVGEWRSGRDGAIEEWRDNEEYQPSPMALDWPDPTDPVDAALQLAATGYGPEEDVNLLLASADVEILLAPNGDVLTVSTSEGTAAVPIFSSLEHLYKCGPIASATIPVVELLSLLPLGYQLLLNTTGPVSMAIEPGALQEQLDSHDAEPPAVAGTASLTPDQADPARPDLVIPPRPNVASRT
jgi:hypothetical protein